MWDAAAGAGAGRDALVRGPASVLPRGRRPGARPAAPPPSVTSHHAHGLTSALRKRDQKKCVLVPVLPAETPRGNVTVKCTRGAKLLFLKLCKVRSFNKRITLTHT